MGEEREHLRWDLEGFFFFNIVWVLYLDPRCACVLFLRLHVLQFLYRRSGKYKLGSHLCTEKMIKRVTLQVGHWPTGISCKMPSLCPCGRASLIGTKFLALVCLISYAVNSCIWNLFSQRSELSWKLFSLDASVNHCCWELFKVAVLSSLIKVIFKCLPACSNGKWSFTAAALHVLQIIRAPAVYTFLPDASFFLK